MHLGDREDINFASLHGLHSDQLHLHIYAASPPLAADSSFSRSSQPEEQPWRSSVSGLRYDPQAVPRGSKGISGNQGSKGVSSSNMSFEQLKAADKDLFPNGTTDTKWRRSDIQMTADGTQRARDLQLQDRKAHPAACSAEGSCRLILAADIALNDLERLPDILGTFMPPASALITTAQSARLKGTCAPLSPDQRQCRAAGFLHNKVVGS